MPNVSPLALVDPVTGDLAAPRLRAVPPPFPAASLASLAEPLLLASPGAAGIYRLPDVVPDAAMIGYLVLVPVGTELDVTAVPVRVGQPAVPAARTAESHPAAAREATGARAARPAGPEQPGQAHEQQRPKASAGATQTSGGIVLDLERRTARVDGELLDLTYLEFELLAHLTGHPYRVHTRDHLVSAVWGYGHVGDGRTVDVHVARLRRKLGRHRDGIVTVRRVGYKYVPSSTR